MAVGLSKMIVAAVVGASCALAAQTGPKIPYESWGACPFECCTYRTWTVQTDTDILSERRDGAPKRFAVARGARVVGVTGVVVTTKVGRAVVERETTIGRARTRVQPRDEILLLHYLGEGYWKYWLRGKIDEEFIPDPENCKRSAQRSPTMFAQCAVQEKERPETVWWVTVRNQAGQEGWTRQVDHFGNIDACGVSEADQPKPHSTRRHPAVCAPTPLDRGWARIATHAQNQRIRHRVGHSGPLKRPGVVSAWSRRTTTRAGDDGLRREPGGSS